MVAKADMAVFAKLSADQIGRLADAFGESVEEKAPSTEKIRDIVGAGLEESDVRSIAHWLYIFCLSKIDRTDLHRWAGSSPLDEDKASKVCATIDKIRGNTDVEKIKEAFPSMELGMFSRLYRPAAPASDDGKLTKGERQCIEFMAMFGMKPPKGPVPTIRGMLAHRAGDIDPVELVREIRDG